MVDDDKGHMGAVAHLMTSYTSHFERTPGRLPELYELPGAILGVLALNWEQLSEAERGALAMTAAALRLHSRKPGVYFVAWLRSVGRLILRKLGAA